LTKQDTWAKIRTQFNTGKTIKVFYKRFGFELLMTQLLADMAKQLGHLIQPILQQLEVLLQPILQLLDVLLQPILQLLELSPQPIFQQLDSLKNQTPLPVVNTKFVIILGSIGEEPVSLRLGAYCDM
jgi:hypothetical protein